MALNLKDKWAEADKKWGAFRKWIALHPLTGFWTGVGAGVGLGILGGLIL